MENAVVNDGFIESVRAGDFISSPPKVPKQLTPSCTTACRLICVEQNPVFYVF